MEIILIVYFAINIFLAGYWFNENDRWENRYYAVLFSSVCLFFGVLGYLIYLFFKFTSFLFSPILGYIYKEISFQYRFYFTNYWDNILLDDNYSEDYKTHEEKLERMKQIMAGFSKQVDRQVKQIENKYKNK